MGLSIKMSLYKRFSKKLIFSLVFLCLNIGIFIYANTQPIEWQQVEMVSEDFYWSADLYGQDINKLHSEFRFEDLEKIFYPKRVQGVYRARPLSFLLEIFSSKLRQWTEQSSFHNYTLILLHLLNTGLVYLLIYRLLNNRACALGCAMLFLNSGIALSTLFFPFRNARVLGLTSVLLAWLSLLKGNIRFCDLPKKRINLFCFFTLTAFYSDEFTFFVYPLILVYLLLRDGKSIIANGDTNKRIFITASIYILLFLGLLNVAQIIDPSRNLGEYNVFLNFFMTEAFSSMAFLFNIMESYFFYFLRFILGYWDHTISGMLASGACVIFLFLFFLNKKKKSDIIFAAIVFVWIFIKALLIPHPAGVHPHIMPAHAQFPSILYFAVISTFSFNILIQLLSALGLSIRELPEIISQPVNVCPGGGSLAAMFNITFSG